MAEDNEQYFFSHKAIVEGMIKRQGLHEGNWMLTVELGLKGTNISIQTDEQTTLSPAGIVIISKIGISRTKEPNDLSVDAAEVNPVPQPRTRTANSGRRGARRSSKKRL